MEHSVSDIDLQEGVLPISAAASQLAKRIKQVRATKRPVVITQKGYPSGVLLDVESYIALKLAAEQALREAPPTP
jgi:prevent-host-death family protein